MKNTTFKDEAGLDQPFWMGCYGIGVTRLLAVLAELNHDDHGLSWPMSSAPFHVVLVALGANREPAVATAAEQAYEALTGAGYEVLYDDRDASAGIKFADADLIGCPIRVVIGAKGVKAGVAEVRDRRSGETIEVPLSQVLEGQLSA
jgi:prolyl-tRNA synthetase